MYVNSWGGFVLKLVGGFLIFLALYELQNGFNWFALGWFLLGLFLIAVEEWVLLFGHTVRYIHRDKQ